MENKLNSNELKRVCCRTLCNPIKNSQDSNILAYFIILWNELLFDPKLKVPSKWLESEFKGDAISWKSIVAILNLRPKMCCKRIDG